MIEEHTCPVQGRSACAPCMQFEVALWNAINRYAISVGGNPAKHIEDNVARMQAVADVGTIVRHAHLVEPPDDLPTNPDCQGVIGTIGACGSEDYYCSDRCWTIGRLQAARVQVTEYERRLGLAELALDYRHLKRLYRESRQYVDALERERDDLVEACNRGGAEQDRLDNLVDLMRPVYEAAKLVRDRMPGDAAERHDDPFYRAIIGLTKTVEHAIEADFEASFVAGRGVP